METKATEQQEVREYLLGRLPPDEQAQFEEQLLTNDELFEELIIVEDELVDEYLDNELSPPDRDQFESHFLAAPEHKEKLHFARTFRKYVAAGAAAQRSTAESKPETIVATSPPRKVRWFGFLPIRNPALGYALATLLVLSVVCVVWLVWQKRLSPGSQDPGKVLSVVLAPGLSRGEGEASNRIVIPADTDTVRLQLLLPENRYSSYQATLIDIDGRELTPQTSATSEILNGERIAVFDVPADVLLPGDYRVKLNGVDQKGNPESFAAYSFSVQGS